MRSLYGIGRESWVREMPRVPGWLVRIPPTKWGSIPSSAVCQLAGVYSGRPLPAELNKQYILYIILLLAEGVAPCASRLGNVLTLALFEALA